MLRAVAEKFASDHEQETLDLLRVLGKIPSPSHNEDKRAAFVKKWLEDIGAEGVYIDDAKNVVWPINVKEGEPIVAISAHTDIVFEDTEELPMKEEDGKLYAPGIGDDTANLVQLMMCCKYLMQTGLKTKCGLLMVANSCEEGLGNLDGMKQLFKDYQGRIVEHISFDGGMTSVINDAVGSHRYRIHIQSEGGHSYGNFGNQNAIACMADLINDLYKVEVPEKAKTTYNVGTIKGGSTVNSIAEECEMLYEYRSATQECLKIMEDYFNAVIEANRKKGYDIEVEILGIRPSMGDVDPEKNAALTSRVKAILSQYTDKEIGEFAASTDCNIPLSQGIPAACFGCYTGKGAHTRGEWIELESMKVGQRIALETVDMYTEE